MYDMNWKLCQIKKQRERERERENCSQLEYAFIVSLFSTLIQIGSAGLPFREIIATSISRPVIVGRVWRRAKRGARSVSRCGEKHVDAGFIYYANICGSDSHWQAEQFSLAVSFTSARPQPWLTWIRLVWTERRLACQKTHLRFPQTRRGGGGRFSSLWIFESSTEGGGREFSKLSSFDRGAMSIPQSSTDPCLHSHKESAGASRAHWKVRRSF